VLTKSIIKKLDYPTIVNVRRRLVMAKTKKEELEKLIDACDERIQELHNRVCPMAESSIVTDGDSDLF